MQISRSILAILVLIAACAVIGTIFGSKGHAQDATMASVIGMAAVIAGLMPVRFAADRSAVGLFQSAWIGSILHLAVFFALGASVIFTRKLPEESQTPFVIWLLAMYWLTLAGLCVTLVKVMRSEISQAGGTTTGTPATKGE